MTTKDIAKKIVDTIKADIMAEKKQVNLIKKLKSLNMNAKSVKWIWIRI